MGNDLLILEAPSITAGFKILNALPKVKLLDAEPVGGSRYLVVVQGAISDLAPFAKEMKVADDFELIESFDQGVLDAIYSLAPNKLNGSLVLVETESAVAMYAIAHLVVKHHGLRAIEIKIRKSSSGAYAYFTGEIRACQSAAADVMSHLASKSRKGTVEVFDRPSEHIRSLFGD